MGPESRADLGLRIYTASTAAFGRAFPMAENKPERWTLFGWPIFGILAAHQALESLD